MGDFFKEEYLSYVILFLFAFSSILYLNLDGLPLSHPGNLKAADPFYHSIAVEGILDTKQWNYYDSYISLGKEKEASLQPPLYYLSSSILTSFSSLPAWVTLYFLICISMAFYVVILYLISLEIFENNKISLISSFFASLPMPLSVWLYGLYIGLWLQIVSNLFILTFIWLFVRYFKRKEQWNLFFIGLTLVGVMLVHPQDLGVLFLPTLLLGIYIIQVSLKSKDFKFLLKSFALLGGVFLVVFLVLIPRFLFVWGDEGGSQFKLGLYGIRSVYFNKEYSGGLVYPILSFIPWYILVIFLITLVQLFLNRKKYKTWLLINLYYFLIIYLTPIIIEQPYYFIRLRTMTPFFLYPTIAYGIYFFIIKSLKKIKFSELIVVSLIFVFLVFSSIQEYNTLKDRLKYEHLPIEEWKVYQWIQANTDKESKLLFYGGVFQSESIYTKRITAYFDMNEYQRKVNEYVSTNTTPLVFEGEWGANTLRSHKIETDFWTYSTYLEPNRTYNILDFDYVIFQDLTPDLANINRFFVSEYINKYNFNIVYNTEGYIILKNEKKEEL